MQIRKDKRKLKALENGVKKILNMCESLSSGPYLVDEPVYI